MRSEIFGAVHLGIQARQLPERPAQLVESYCGPSSHSSPCWGGASADFLEARPPAPHVDRRQHVAFALGRDRQRMPGVQKIEDALLQRVPFVFVKLGIVAGVAEVCLVKHRGVRRPALGTGAIKQVGEAGEVHLRLAVVTASVTWTRLSCSSYARFSLPSFAAAAPRLPQRRFAARPIRIAAADCGTRWPGAWCSAACRVWLARWLRRS